jgi:hypothetical protein
MQDTVQAYYARDEIGFGGPAYPRGYMRLKGGKAEPWEVEERRYEWEAPLQSLWEKWGCPAKCSVTESPGTACHL